jgi:hypothetical protein
VIALIPVSNFFTERLFAPLFADRKNVPFCAFVNKNLFWKMLASLFSVWLFALQFANRKNGDLLKRLEKEKQIAKTIEHSD